MRLNVPVYEGFQINVNSDIVRLISEDVAKKYQVMPLEIKNNALQLATSDPLDFYALGRYQSFLRNPGISGFSSKRND